MELADKDNENLEQAGIVTSDGEDIPSTSLRTSESSSSSSEFEEGTASLLSKISSRILKSDKFRWEQGSNGYCPQGGFVGGVDIDQQAMYVARANYSGDLIPGKLLVAQRTAYVSYHGKEIERREYEVLIDNPNFRWQRVSGSYVPLRAVPGGKTKDGETLYIGRVHYNGSITIGKVHQSHCVCYIPYGGKELRFSKFQILCA